MISFYGWSPDSTWLAYWTFTAAEAVDTYGISPPGKGRLHFLNLRSGQTCSHPDAARYGASVVWQPDNTVIVASNISKQGFPCSDKFADVAKPTDMPTPSTDVALSPGGHYRATSVERARADDIVSVVTQIIETKTGRTKNVVKWREPLGLGELGLGGGMVN